ncbi:MAG TPA: BlaI/MecI/CopY family transcriptional regulator [Candidatus Pelethocola excrementipullorum]|nr:BlaI/MecI/CopY family transcriptional regulator [Candidatus Pelethocola excrementipullorum]
MVQISDSELELLKIIWENEGRILFSELVSILHQRGSNWKNNTILTFLSRLTEKNILKVNKIGRRNEYVAKLTEKEYLENQTDDFIHNVYEGDVKGLISTLVDKNLISSKEIDELKDYWKHKKDNL